MSIISLLFIIAVGVVSGWYYVKILKKPVNIWMSVVMGIIGSVLGGFFLGHIMKYLYTNPLDVDFVATFIGAFFLIWFFSKLLYR